MEGTYQHEMVCPSCGKRKVFVKVEDTNYIYYCTACSYEWGG